MAASPVDTGGLVNVTVTNVLNNNKVVVSIPIQAAVNICGVNVLTALPGQSVTCTASPAGNAVTVTIPQYLARAPRADPCPTGQGAASRGQAAGDGSARAYSAASAQDIVAPRAPAAASSLGSRAAFRRS